MAIDPKSKLKQDVEAFLKSRQAPQQEVIVKADSAGDLTVIFGEDEVTGIIGLGSSPETALNDFITNWKRLIDKEDADN